MRHAKHHATIWVAIFAASTVCACHHGDSLAKRESVKPEAGANASGGANGKKSTDDAIRTAVFAELRKDTKIDHVGLIVTVTDGIAVLTGKVDNVLSKTRATRIAEAVRG